MRRGSTPIVTITVPNQDFDDCNVYVTIDQDGNQVTKASRTSEDIEITKNYDDEGELLSSDIAVYLTQSETMQFAVGKAEVQVRWIDTNENAYVTDISKFKLERTLLEGVIEYGD